MFEKQKNPWCAVMVALLLGATGCVSEATPSDPSGGGGGGGGGSGTVSFATDVQPIFNQTCASSSCHGSSESGGLDLRAGASHGELVNVLAESEAVIRAIPGNAQGSYLVMRLEGRQSTGASMPLTGNLTSDQIQTIRAWIDQGAADN